MGWSGEQFDVKKSICWQAQLSQHFSHATLPSIIGQHPSSGSLLHLFKSLDMYSLMGIPDTRGILHCKVN